jgi:hypothetical protein
MPGTITLDTDHPADPEYTRAVAGALAECVRVLNHQTAKDGALAFPSDVDALVQSLAVMASGLPQLLRQIGAWLRGELAGGRLDIGYGDYADDPYLAVADIGALLDEARQNAELARRALDEARQITATISAARTGNGNGNGNEGDAR